MDRSQKTQIADPIYGTVGLTEVEIDVIDTQVFQRLSNISQLGVVPFVFPGAQYTRFAHSIGVCHVAGKILDSIRETPGFEELSDESWEHEWQRYRLAALLHDIGHYPFSHAYEQALKRANLGEHGDHEQIGGMVLKYDEELKSVLEQHGYEPESISAIFKRTNLKDVSTRLKDIVSSGLDADRLDYLRRTAHYTGVPYGNIDGEYLISQFQLDGNGDVCITNRARLTADHFLLSRWFEYQQIIFHHTVQAADYTLEDVLIHLIGQFEEFECTRESVREKIQDGSWATFDDAKVMETIRDLKDLPSEDLEMGDDSPPPEILKDKCSAILDRKLPKTVFENSRFRDCEKRDGRPLVDDALDELADDHNLNRERFYLWTNTYSFTKISPGSKRELDHVLRIGEPVREKHDVSEKPVSEVIVNDSEAVTSLLADKERFRWRLYVLFPDDWSGERIRNKKADIRKSLLEDYLHKEEEEVIAEGADS
ncbi:hypothetical protein GGP81_002086 [Salinibacter ruber]|uniref:HD domain-containing protein n=1 Tax=Salinibacter ruber TaxID=146919 RepID=UPI00216A0A49|nr:HD domain-containing protein [Salinibacter ruber]MCS3955555.1 hypothetical protein [Salinibacter ruber]